jgi:hypothetical protein
MERKRLKFIGCEIVYREVCYLTAMTPHRVDVEFLHGVHDLETGDMLGRVQAAVDAADEAGDYDAILLGFGRCNDGVVGLTAKRTPLVIPKAHDCITLFFGSRQAYQEYFDSHSGTYYKTSGWVERQDVLEGDGDDPKAAHGPSTVMDNLGLAQSYESLVEQYGEENAAFIAESMGDWTKDYTRYLYLKMGVWEEDDYIEQIRQEAEEKGWEFELREGSLSLLEKQLFGDWDEDFVVVPPGGQIAAQNDETALKCEALGPE